MRKARHGVVGEDCMFLFGVRMVSFYPKTARVPIGVGCRVMPTTQRVDWGKNEVVFPLLGSSFYHTLSQRVFCSGLAVLSRRVAVSISRR